MFTKAAIFGKNRKSTNVVRREIQLPKKWKFSTVVRMQINTTFCKTRIQFEISWFPDKVLSCLKSNGSEFRKLKISRNELPYTTSNLFLGNLPGFSGAGSCFFEKFRFQLCDPMFFIIFHRISAKIPPPWWICLPIETNLDPHLKIWTVKSSHPPKVYSSEIRFWTKMKIL